MNESCHIWMCHGAHRHESWRKMQVCQRTHTNLAHIWRRATHEWVMSHLWNRHGTRMEMSNHIHYTVIPHIGIRNVTHTKGSWHTYRCVIPHTWMSHGTMPQMNESWHNATHEWVMTQCHTWMHDSILFIKDSSPYFNSFLQRFSVHSRLLTAMQPSIHDYRVPKTHRMPYLHRSISAKQPYTKWLFCRKWLAT